jgi:predicted CXXCH cytochrome family protein
MTHTKPNRKRTMIAAFCTAFAVCLALGSAFSLAWPAAAQEPTPPPPPAVPTGRYAGPAFCGTCHVEIHHSWEDTRHAQAFSVPIFQQNWQDLGGEFTCLECHTTGYDPVDNTYAAEGVTCESCHGPFTPGHPDQPMPITPDATLCSTCHKTTTDEWHASRHGQVGINCQGCHNPHSQQPLAASSTDLCTNCHRDTGSGFTHGTHASAGLQCSSCHMYTSRDGAAPISGLVPTGHTFSVGSEACIGCHQDTIHTRDTILALSGESSGSAEIDPETLRAQIQEQEEHIADLEASASVRLYTGLAQGAIVGLMVGSVAAWIVSRRIQIVDVEEDME